jgi:hypothetical protein
MSEQCVPVRGARHVVIGPATDDGVRVELQRAAPLHAETGSGSSSWSNAEPVDGAARVGAALEAAVTWRGNGSA